MAILTLNFFLLIHTNSVWFIEVNVERISTGNNTVPLKTIALNPRLNTRYISGNDAFVRTSAKINPAVQNPVYALNDDFLIKLFPKEYIGKYSNEQILKAIAEQNPNIKAILKDVLDEVKIYPQNVSTEAYPHFLPTAKAATDIMKYSKENFSKQNLATMHKAALLHDVGKGYIPDSILNKNGRLDDYERKVVDKHAHLGYEVLRSTGAEAPILELVKNHHTYSKNNPPMVQILQIADIYSALKEQRPYKAPFSDEKALSILYERANNKDFNTKYVNALEKSLAS